MFCLNQLTATYFGYHVCKTLYSKIPKNVPSQFYNKKHFNFYRKSDFFIEYFLLFINMRYIFLIKLFVKPGLTGWWRGGDVPGHTADIVILNNSGPQAGIVRFLPLNIVYTYATGRI